MLTDHLLVPAKFHLHSESDDKIHLCVFHTSHSGSGRKSICSVYELLYEYTYPFNMEHIMVSSSIHIAVVSMAIQGKGY